MQQMDLNYRMLWQNILANLPSMMAAETTRRERNMVFQLKVLALRTAYSDIFLNFFPVLYCSNLYI